jgi:uncharacterized protein (DUF2141 family)
MIRFWILIFLLFLSPRTVHAQILRLKISNIRSDQGVLVISLFKSQEQFKSDQPAFIKKVSKAGLNDSTIVVDINNLEPGMYGIAVLDDENENGDMDYRFKRPTEGFGFSNYYHHGLFRPKFEDFCFELGKIDIMVKVFMKYIKETD